MKKYMLIQKHLFTNKFLDEQATHIMVYHLLKCQLLQIYIFYKSISRLGLETELRYRIRIRLTYTFSFSIWCTSVVVTDDIHRFQLFISGT